MKLLPRILNRIVFVRAEYLPSREYSISLHIRHRGALTDADWKHIKGLLSVVVICGCGVVTKPDNTEAAARVRADDETFLWTSTEGRTSFVRREGMQGLLAELAEHKTTPICICCADATTDFLTTANTYAAQVYDRLQWRSLIRLSDESSAVAQALVRRLALPILGGFLVLLTCNMLFSSRLNARKQSLQAELVASKHTTSELESIGVRQRELLAEFTARPATPRTISCDRIARTVPERVELTALEIEPLTKRFEAGKPLLRRENTAILCGSASSTADISLFTTRLTELASCHHVRLTNVEKERNGDRLEFRIELKL